MAVYERARRVYWRIVGVPGIGSAVRRLGTGGRELLRRLVSPTGEPIEVLLERRTARDVEREERLDERLAGVEARIAESWRALGRLGEQAGAAAAAVEVLATAQDQDRTARSAVEARVATIEKAVADISASLADIEGRLQTRIAALGDQLGERVGELSDQLGQRAAKIESRVQFVRAEALFEVRALGNATPHASAAVPQPEIVNRPKHDAMASAGNVKVNLGCGHLAREDYLNVDARRLPGVDVLATAAALPFEPGSVSEIYSSHLLEHFPAETLRRSVLRHWIEILRPGGLLRAVVPDAEAMLQGHAGGEVSFEDLSEVTFGLQEYDGDFHFAMFSRDGLRRLLADAGLVDVAYAFVGRRNGKCFDMEIRATKPSVAGDEPPEPRTT